MLRDELLVSALAVIRHHEETGDPESVLSGTADDLISGLGFMTGSGADLEVLQVLGWLHWFRFEELIRRYEFRRASLEQRKALDCLRPVYLADPLAVPEKMERQLKADPGAAVGYPEHDVPPDDIAWGFFHAAAELASTIPQCPSREEADAKLARVRYAVEFFPQGWTGLAAMTLGGALISHDGFAADGDGVSEAIELLRRALPSPGLAGQNTLRNLLAVALQQRFRRCSDTQDLAEALSLLSADGGIDSANASLSLAHALHDEYVTTGRFEHLVEAIRSVRQSLEGESVALSRSSRLGYLSNLLCIRGEHAGDGDSLEEAVGCARQALDLVPAKGRADVLTDLGHALSSLSRHSRDSGLYMEAADCFHRVLDLLPDPTPKRRAALANLATTLFTLYRKGSLRDKDRGLARIDEGIALLREALNLPGNTEDQRHLWATLGTGFRRRYEWTEDPGLLDDVVDACRNALDAPHALNVHNVWNAYARAVRDRFDSCHDPADLAEAIRAVRVAAEAPDAGPHQHKEAAARWGRWAAEAGDRDEALRGFRSAVGVLPRVALRHLRREDQERRLMDSFELVSDAAAAALDAGRPGMALDFLETGRGVMLHAALDSDSELAGLTAAGNPGLAEKYAALRDEVDDGRLASDRRHELTAELDRTLDAIRRTPGFERFQLPPTPAALAALGAQGPVIIVNVSDRRCDALVLTRSVLKVVPLTALTQDELRERVQRFHRAMAMVDDRSAGYSARGTAQVTVQDTLAWLWDVAAGPILDTLGYTEPVADGKKWPRVWWSPTGWLTQLPLHAAGHHSEGGPSVLNRVISSYTPTLRTLLKSRRATGERAERSIPRVLAVAVPDTPGQPPLAATDQEVAAVAKDPTRPPLRQDRATRRNVLDRLTDCDWAHFACHAHVDQRNPSASYLVLHDQPVTVTDIDRLRLTAPELAYLSACSTGSAPVLLAAEAIHLASAFQLAGFGHVIATLWKANDSRASTMASSFYARLPRQTGLPPAAFATALHHAICQARDADPNLPASWAGYFHTGP